MTVSGGVALVLERVAYRRLIRLDAPKLVALISAIGASFALAEFMGLRDRIADFFGLRDTLDPYVRSARDNTRFQNPLETEGVFTVGGYLGGHLSYVQAIGVERKAFAGGPKEWTAVLDTAELEEATPRVVQAGDTDVMLYREGNRLHALWATCTHEGGPLAEGTFHDGCVTCPWHGSTFRLEDGKVVRGPAASSQPVYEARVTDGKVEVRTVP